MIAQELPLLVERHQVADYLPHRAPMVMIDRLLSSNAGIRIGELRVRPDNPFLTPDGELLLGGVLEHLAQTAGLGQAYEQASSTGRAVDSQAKDGNFGFIVNIRSVKYQRKARLGETLRTEARTVTQNGTHSTVAFTCSVGQQKIIDCTMGLMAPSPQKKA